MAHELLKLDRPEAVAEAGAEVFAREAARAFDRRGRFTVALSGGTTPRAMFALLAHPPYVDQVDWAQVWVFWGDERCVPPDDPQSNYRVANEVWLQHVPVPEGHIHRIRGERDPEAAARAYERVLRESFPAADRPGGPPGEATLDLIYLGLGADGHTASLFPGTEGLDERDRWVVAHHVPDLATWRISLTAPTLNAGRRIVFLVTGASKRNALHRVLEGDPEPDKYPAQLIQPRWGRLTWIVDRAAAAVLDSSAEI